eukprot:12581437-Alexandrium_andersonii.AAC.1
MSMPVHEPCGTLDTLIVYNSSKFCLPLARSAPEIASSIASLTPGLTPEAAAQVPQTRRRFATASSGNAVARTRQRCHARHEHTPQTNAIPAAVHEACIHARLRAQGIRLNAR